MAMGTVLAWTILLPLVGGVAIALIPQSGSKFARPVALLVTGVVLAMATWLWISFNPADPGMQFEIVRDWVPGLGTAFHLGVDGLSLPMLFLTAFLSLLAVIASARISEFTREYFTLILLLEAGLIGVFIALDLILFYVFWEVVLIPMFFLINIWGGPRRRYAAIKFFLYTLAGSLAMLGGIISLFLATGAQTFDMIALAPQAARLSLAAQTAIFTAIAFALAIKVPMVPLHTWLPDAHVEAPTAVSVLLAGVLLKMGSYGFLRFGPQLLPDGFERLVPLIALLGVVSIVYGAACALVQTDLKKLIAYSSVSHMGYVMLGIAAGTAAGVLGASVQMFSHGLIAGMAFLLVGAYYERAHTREISAFGGTARVAPILAGTLVFMSFASLGLPGMSGFIGEFMVVTGSFGPFTTYSAIAAFAVVLTAGYLLWMLRRVVFGQLNEARADMPDMTRTEAAAIFPLCIATLCIGVFPQVLVGVMEASVESVAKILGA
ncbi:MAG: NADH-quinone oxidoreductase subunit M [Coriobacteriales bacterium]|nr:NADH-quinone oxidoreductase subunit M [Coriobacteriales bacterium]